MNAQISEFLYIECRCGKSMKVAVADTGKHFRCKRCGTITRLTPEGEPSAPVYGTDSPLVEPDEGWSIPTAWLAAIAITSFVGLCIVSVLSWQSGRVESEKVRTANAELIQAIATANEWIVDGRLNDAKGVEQGLVNALAAEHVSDRKRGHEILDELRRRRKELDEERRVGIAKLECEQVYQDAKRKIAGNDARLAISLLQEYVANPFANHKPEARLLLEDLLVANSNTKVLEMLLDLDDASYLQVMATGKLPNSPITRPGLEHILAATVRRTLPRATKRRVELYEKQQRQLAEKARLEAERRAAEEQRLALDAEAKRRMARDLESLIEDPTELEQYFFLGEYNQGVLDFQTRLLDHPTDDHSRFSLALLQFFQAVQYLGQDLHRYGVKQTSEDIPFLRLPVPINKAPKPLTHRDFRRILDDFVRRLDAVDGTLANISGDVGIITLRLEVIRFDMDADGQAEDDFEVVFEALHREEYEFLKDNPGFKVEFDRADAAWLRIYCQLMATVLDAVLAIDTEPFFNEGADHVFEDPIISDRKFEAEAELRFLEPARLERVRRRLILITDLNHEMWKYARYERDKGLEWMPNSKQKSVLGFTVNDNLVTSWLDAMSAVKVTLEGKRTFPRMWAERDGMGLDLKKILQDPPEKIDTKLIEGFPDSIPDKYFSDAPDFDVFVLYAVFFSYQSWFDRNSNDDF